MKPIDSLFMDTFRLKKAILLSKVFLNKIIHFINYFINTLRDLSQDDNL